MKIKETLKYEEREVLEDFKDGDFHIQIKRVKGKACKELVIKRYFKHKNEEFESIWSIQSYNRNVKRNISEGKEILNEMIKDYVNA